MFAGRIKDWLASSKEEVATVVAQRDQLQIEVLGLQGRLCLAEGNAEAAVAVLTKAKALAPGHLPTLTALGHAQAELGRRAEARSTTLELAARYPVYAMERLPSHPTTYLPSRRRRVSSRTASSATPSV